jgi:DNA polymerase III alpha subunit
MDIDIDTQSTFLPKKIFPQIIQASMIKNDQLIKHPCGFFMQSMAMDSVTKLAAIPYEEAEVVGYTKIDFLHLSLLDIITSKQELKELSNKEPDWELLQDRQQVRKLLHIHNQFELVQRIKPTSVQELADILALMRPSKTYLISQYVFDIGNRDKIRVKLYQEPIDGGVWFKKSHSIAYSLNIVVQLNLISQGRI